MPQFTTVNPYPPPQAMANPIPSPNQPLLGQRPSVVSMHSIPHQPLPNQPPVMSMPPSPQYPVYQQQPMYQQQQQIHMSQMSPQPFIMPMPMPQPQFVAEAPAHLRPLYVSQFMFVPSQPLVQKKLPLDKNGNLVIDFPLSSQILKYAKYAENKEFTHLTYTPVLCEPNDFPKKYSLRQTNANRQIKVAIVCTMYNEGPDRIFSPYLQDRTD